MKLNKALTKVSSSMTPSLRVLSALLVMACGSNNDFRDAPQPHSHPHHMSTPKTEAMPEHSQYDMPKALDLSHLSDLNAIIPQLATKRVVFVGETHDRFDHHLNQLEIIRRLHVLHPDLVIGMEYFQQPFQSYLDQYIAGELTEKGLLKNTEYFDRWRFDYRLYRPILRYAKQHNIPLLALNVPQEITSKVGQFGLASLTDKERQAIPAVIDESDADYRRRLKEVFDQHPGSSTRSFEWFLQVQLLWDEGMAECAATYLRNHPRHHMVVLAGSGHLAYGTGIPKRLTKRLDVETAVVLNGTEAGLTPDIADYLLLPNSIELPPAGKLGIYMSDTPQGVTVDKFSDGSAVKEVGMKQGDQIISLNGEPVHTSADVRIALLGKQPGDNVEVGIRRINWFNAARQLVLSVDLR
jgi:uncharacterized iron-regulated protein